MPGNDHGSLTVNNDIGGGQNQPLQTLRQTAGFRSSSIKARRPAFSSASLIAFRLRLLQLFCFQRLTKCRIDPRVRDQFVDGFQTAQPHWGFYDQILRSPPSESPRVLHCIALPTV